MSGSNNHEKFLTLRSKFPFFVYEGFDYQYNESGLNVHFHFNLADTYFFHPSLFIPLRRFFIPENVQDKYLHNLLFHIGMIELISYWKAACPPTIIVKNSLLNEDQVNWWKKLYFNGLGEFFYLNSIRTSASDFTTINCSGDLPVVPFSMKLKDLSVIPIGGGKDSIVTLELLSSVTGNILMIINPREASTGSAIKKGYSPDSIIEVHRTIDPQLLKLNEEGFLNGHTPFSALLAFISILTAIMSGRRYIALSNESSANEMTVGNSEINHQYSKSYEFESDFRKYIKKYISADLEYFSFLRPLNELQIAGLFSRFPEYFDVFRSCNAGSKNNSWCCKCPKCLFTWIILSPFLKEDKLEEIFGRNLLNDPELFPVFEELTGVAETKPFDCVGTIDEVNASLKWIIDNYQGAELPMLLQKYITSGAYVRYQHYDIRHLLHSYNKEHNLPQPFEELLISYVHT